MQIFVFCAFPIHLWTIVNMLRDVPSWLHYMKTVEIIGSVAYTLTFALFETMIVFVIVLVVGMVLPKRWVPYTFVPLSSVMLIELAIMAGIFQHFILQYLPKRLLLVSFLMILGLTVLTIPKFSKIAVLTRSLAERFAVLTVLYVLFDFVGLIIVIARNV